MQNRERTLRSLSLWLLTIATPTICVEAHSQQLPARSQWRASSSATDNSALAPAYAIDGDLTTRWGGPFSPGHWLQIDLGKAAHLGGVTIRWDNGFTETYLIQASLDAKRWQTVSDIEDGSGNVEYLLFAPVQARYLRLASKPKTADWGVSVLEFEPIAASDAPQLESKNPNASLWTGAATQAVASTLNIRLPAPMEVAGLQIFWGAERKSARLEARRSNGAWHTLAEDPQPFGDMSYLSARQSQTVSALRLVTSGSGPPASIRRLRLLSPTQVMTPLKRYEIQASRADRALFPDTLHRQQVYWTVVGIPAGRQKSVFDEYGNLEAFKGSPMVQPLWRNESGATVAATTARRSQKLREGWMPMPTVEWSPQPGLTLQTDALAIARNGAPVTMTRYRLRNTGNEPVKGQLALIVRPLQVNPPWQHGGIAPIRRVQIDGAPQAASVKVNGRTFLHSLSPVDASAAAAFGAHGESEITAAVVSGKLPGTSSAQDRDGLAAAVLRYRVELQPREQRDVVLAFPLGNEHVDFAADSLPGAPAIDRSELLGSSTNDAGKAFDVISSQVAQQWQDGVGKIQLSLPDRSLVDMMRAQTAYMLLNQTGPALQPGPRNYNRSFLRDGSATASILARMGMVDAARDYLRWYADHAVHPSGLVSPILNEDGSVNRGFGSDLEHDSQGQFVWLVAEIARVDGGPASVREFEPQVKLALTYLKELRDRTMVRGYLADREAPQRFHGVLAPSISHEGYAVPTHSYWDDYWGLKGWHDAIWLAQSWGNAELAKWCREQYEALRASVRRSIEATIAWRGIDYVPASADLGDWDPTSVSIGIDPANQMDLMPEAALRRTFDRYLAEVRRRDEPGALYAYTPYELRNVLTYVHLNKPQVANELLMNFMRHRRPSGWHVFAEVVHSLERRDRYMGDMPHTWIGAEYVRMIFGMLMQEDDKRLRLLPGVPQSWVAGDGIRIGDLPVTYGRLTLSARQRGNTLHVTLGPGLRAETQLAVVWPARRKPVRVSVDGRVAQNFDEQGIELNAPFREVIAQW